MREILISIATIVGALAIVAAVVFAGRDPALFVPPPDAVAEAFGRALGSGRYDVARRYLSRDARRQQSVAALETQFGSAKNSIGAIDRADATELSRDADRASAACELTGEHGAVTLTVAVTREHGLWTIDSWQVHQTR
jgi:hypothetical protein